MKRHIIMGLFIIPGSIFAMQNNTPKELYTTFSAIEKIHRIAADVAKEAKNNNMLVVLQLGKQAWGVNSYYNKTAQGLYLITNNGLPEFLATPWGEVKLYGSLRGPGDYASREVAYKFMFEAFKKGLTLKFIKCFHESQEKQQELDALRGTDAHIPPSLCSSDSIYEISAVEDTVLPKAEETAETFSGLAADDYKATQQSWQEIQQKYLENNPE